MKNKVIAGLSWDLFGSISLQLIRFVISIFLARLLAPEEFGVVGIALVFINVSQIFIELGLAAALIQNKENSNLLYSSVFYINILAGLFLFGLFQFLAPYIGGFYEAESVEILIRWMSVIFIFSSVSIVHRSILTRDLNFKKLTIRDLGAQFVAGILAIYLAYIGFGIYSLMIQYVLASLLNTILLWTMVKWTPELRFSFTEARKLFGFSVYTFLVRIVNQTLQRIDVLLIGKIFNPATLGYYTRAQTLNNLVTKNSSASLTKVFFPALSKYQDDREKFDDIYYKVVSLIGFVAFGITGIFFILGKDIILMLFGDKWLESVAIFKLLILTAFTYPINAIVVNAFLSLGLAKVNFKMGLLRSLLMLLPVTVGYFLGLTELLITYIVVTYFILIFNVVLLKLITGIKLTPHIHLIFSGGLPLLAAYLLIPFFGERDLLFNMLMASVFAVVYLGFNYYANSLGFGYLLTTIKKFRNKTSRA